jgi:hypothetical protein
MFGSNLFGDSESQTGVLDTVICAWIVANPEVMSLFANLKGNAGPSLCSG